MGTTADRLATAYFDAIEALCRVTPKGWYAERGTARAGITHAGLASLNGVFALTTDPDLESLDALAIEVARQIPHWSIMVRGAAGEPVVDLAARHGLRERSVMPFLACATDDIVFRPVSTQQALVRRVGAAENDTYTDALTESFEAPEGSFGPLMGGAVLDTDGITGYLAEESDRPVGTALGMLTSGVIGVFNIGVVPSARGRGLGRTLTETVLRDGIAAGANAAYLHTSPMGRPLYESMGFALVENWTMFTAR
ncbi:GNAT family N-acetyltransferase [Micromonospora sp. WMMD964]|uniref:GNAT family N-acetyltransferase n=1 Tax=Micromonospora sp. WMMD964 TaxID=3016091 RepID=UPI00249BD4AB|nr:GNAT family N-acetyltransferase [Micromonospora sp. WMMD964]WFF03831.1 GNAT family N-acetyltransferase [Micromonospora sp. WMMD964]